MSKLTHHSNFDSLVQAVTVPIAQARDYADAWIREHYWFACFQLAFLSLLFFLFLQSAFPSSPLQPQPRNPLPDMSSNTLSTLEATAADAGVKVLDAVVPKPKEVKLEEPKSTPFSKEELAKYDGKDEKTGLYVGIKGKIYDVSAKRDMYGPGKGYHVFVGKDASRGLGKSSLKPEDAVSDYSTLTESELKVLDDWEKYFAKRYNIVGVVSE